MPSITYRDLTTLAEFADVVALEHRIWGPGYLDAVPVPILAVTVKRDGILIGAFAGPSRTSGPSRAGSRDSAAWWASSNSRAAFDR